MAIGISAISVAGFKSLSEESTVEITPLTIFAGANSSGKSSIMQPLLMIKQTLHESYDPGILKINGPNVKFTETNQFLSKTLSNAHNESFTIKISLDNGLKLTETFSKQQNRGLKIVEILYTNKDGNLHFRPGMNQQELIDSSVSFKENWEKFSKAFKVDGKTETSLSVERERCFLKPIAHIKRTSDKGERELSFSFMDLSEPFETLTSRM